MRGAWGSPGCSWLLSLLHGRPGHAQSTPGSRRARPRLSQPWPATLFMKRRWLSVSWGLGLPWPSLAGSGCSWSPQGSERAPRTNPAQPQTDPGSATQAFQCNVGASVLRGSCGAWCSPGSSWLSLAAPGVLQAALGHPKHALRTTAQGGDQNDSQQRDFNHSARRRKNFLGHQVGSQAWGTPQRIHWWRLEPNFSVGISRQKPKTTQNDSLLGAKTLSATRASRLS